MKNIDNFLSKYEYTYSWLLPSGITSAILCAGLIIATPFLYINSKRIKSELNKTIAPNGTDKSDTAMSIVQKNEADTSKLPDEAKDSNKLPSLPRITVDEELNSPKNEADTSKPSDEANKDSNKLPPLPSIKINETLISPTNIANCPDEANKSSNKLPPLPRIKIDEMFISPKNESDANKLSNESNKSNNKLPPLPRIDVRQHITPIDIEKTFNTITNNLKPLSPKKSDPLDILNPPINATFFKKKLTSEVETDYAGMSGITERFFNY